jgi:hypothetical protein
MSAYRAHGLVEAPVQDIWDLLADPRRHPEWWPRIIEVRGEKFDTGDVFVVRSNSPAGDQESKFLVQRRDELHGIRFRCTLTGTYADWKMTEAQGGTYMEVDFGMEDPIGVTSKLFDLTAGRLYFRRWVDQSLEGLRKAASHPDVDTPGDSGSEAAAAPADAS